MPESGWRRRGYVIIFGHDTPAGRAFDVALLVLIALSVVAVMLETVASIKARYGTALLVVEWAFTLLFTVEYGLRLMCVRRPARYARELLRRRRPARHPADVPQPVRRRRAVADRHPRPAAAADLPDPQAAGVLRPGRPAHDGPARQPAEDRRLRRRRADDRHRRRRADVPHRGPRARLLQHPGGRVLGRRHDHDRRLRRHRPADAGRTHPRGGADADRLRHHRRADRHRHRGDDRHRAQGRIRGGAGAAARRRRACARTVAPTGTTPTRGTASCAGTCWTR